MPTGMKKCHNFTDRIVIYSESAYENNAIYSSKTK